MNNPLDLLYKEHEVISEAINVAKDLRRMVDKPELYQQQISELISFFKEYGDKYHHHKEEEILFPEMVKANNLLESGVLQEMLEHHEDFRELIGEIEQLTESRDYFGAQDKLEKYVDLLADHIAVENEEVFEIAKSLFSESELENIYFRFKDIDCVYGENGKNILQEKLNNIDSHVIQVIYEKLLLLK